MKNKNLMHVREKYSLKGELKIQLYCSGKDSFTKKNKVYEKTYTVPSGLKTKKDIEQFKYKCQLEWSETVKQMTCGNISQKQNIYFCDFAEKWVEKILINNNQGYNYYTQCKSNLAILKEKFGKYYLSEMSLPVIQKFCEWLNTRKYVKEVAVSNGKLKEFIKTTKLTQKKLSSACGVSVDTLKKSSMQGKHVSVNSAKKICEYLKLRFTDCFNKQQTEMQYSIASNRMLKTLLHCVLGQAVKEGYIQTNYASSEYTDKLNGTRKKKQIYTQEEALEFLNCLERENDLRKKAAFSIALYLGLRGAEITGLQWSDFDFENSSVTISRNTLYIYGFGTKTKSTKTDSSNRTLSIPENLKGVLLDYKKYWDVEKVRHGDLWENTDKLFVQNNGNDMANSTISHWLRKFQDDNNLKHVTIHGLRHTITTLMLINGVDIKTVSGRLGHKKISTTLDIYAHYVKQADEKASQVIDNILKT